MRADGAKIAQWSTLLAGITASGENPTSQRALEAMCAEMLASISSPQEPVALPWEPHNDGGDWCCAVLGVTYLLLDWSRGWVLEVSVGDEMFSEIGVFKTDVEGKEAAEKDFASKAALLFASPVEPVAAKAEVEGCPTVDDIRSMGWAVAVHNDYRLNGEPHTLWLFTKGDRAVKGEGRTDAEALAAVWAQLPVRYWDEVTKTFGSLPLRAAPTGKGDGQP